MSLSSASWWIEKACRDLYFLCRCILQTLEDPTPGYKDLYYPTHKRMCDFLEKYANPGQRCLILFPRHWIKSYIVSTGWSMQRLLRNAVSGKRDTFLLSHAVEPRAISLKGRLKHNLLYNDLLRTLLSAANPEVAKQLADPVNTAELWTKEEDRIWGNVLMTGAVEKTLESTHFSIHIGDDLVVRENSRTTQQLEKVKNWWKLTRSLLSPGGTEILVGTRWGFDELYGYLIDKFLKPKKNYNLEAPIVEVHRGNFHLLQATCWTDPIKKTGSTFPILFPEKKLYELREELEDEFPYQYESDPIAKGDQKYKRNHFKRYRFEDIPQIVYTVVLIDVTGKEKEQSNYTGIVVVDIGVDRKAYIRMGVRKKITNRNLIDWLCENIPQYNPATICMESTAYTTILELMELVIPQKLRRNEIPEGYRKVVSRFPFMCSELKHGGRPKKIRIENMHGYVEDGTVLFPHQGAEDLIDELLRLGSWGKDDIADAFGYLQDKLTFPEKTDPERVLIVPERLKLSDEEREKKDWEQYKKDSLVGDRSWEEDLW